MRRVFRRDLSPRSARKLEAEQVRADAKHATNTLNVKAEWERARRNKPLLEALKLLQADGRGTRTLYVLW